MTMPTQPPPSAMMDSDLERVRVALDGDYEVLEELGRGGMAIVYRARERMLDREVAIKVLPFAMAFDEGFVERFLREARTAARLEHPHIIPIYRVGRAGHVTYFVMKLLRGHSLSDQLERYGPLSPAETRRVLTETAGALGYAHRNGVVHRDVKPDNILLDETGRCVVTDFGIARSARDTKITSSGMSMGTPRYMSPEQARARTVDGRSDVYSLGIVGYECLAGRVPFDGDDPVAVLMDHVTAPVPRPVLSSGEARELYVVIERMLAKLPEERYASAEELVAVLRGERGGSALWIPTLAARVLTPRSLAASARTTPHAPLYGTLDSGPRSSAALDRALEAGIALLRQQRPRVDHGLAAGRRAVALQGSRVRSLLARVGDRTSRVGAQVDVATSRTVTRVKARTTAAATVHPGRLVPLIAATLLLFVAAPVGAHFALKHRTRCTSVAASSGDGSRFVLLLDEAASVRRNGDVEVYYDVCGLPEGAVFGTRIIVSRIPSGLKRIFGNAPPPIIREFEETAPGLAVRRHRSIDMTDMPGGGYYLTVTVTDARGRRRELGTSFRVRGPE